MKPLALLLAATAMAAMVAGPADARRRHDNGWDDRYDRWENRRDARRAGVIAMRNGGAPAAPDARWAQPSA